MDDEYVIKITVKVSRGTGFCSIKSKDTGKTYKAQGPAYSIIGDSEMARMLIADAMKQLFESDKKGRDREAEAADH